MKKIIVAIIMLGCFCVYAHAQGAESVSITTYYPSPYGVYQQLRLYPDADGISGIGTVCNDRGVMYFDDVANSPLYCNGSPGTWQALGGGGGAYWTQAVNSLYPNDTAWNVGIGTTNLASKLEIFRETGAVDWDVAFDGTGTGDMSYNGDDDLRPVSFTWNEYGVRDFGLIAEEVSEILPELVTNNEEGKPNTVKYKQLSVLLLKELKKLKAEINDLKTELNMLKQQ